MGSHRSRLTAVMIDVPRASYEETVAFWGHAIGHLPVVEADDPDYASLGDATPGLELVVQAVGDITARVHLDIETDDVEAEVRRLTGLGATVLERIATWVVMRDPAGTIFCVVRVEHPEAFEVEAQTWP
jgi:predicted enzyme related to lactoylglutathione lyase